MIAALAENLSFIISKFERKIKSLSNTHRSFYDEMSHAISVVRMKMHPLAQVCSVDPGRLSTCDYRSNLVFCTPIS